MEIIVHPEVDNDLLGHIDYYSRKVVPQIALEFYTEFRRCFDIIIERAASFPLFTHLG